MIKTLFRTDDYRGFCFTLWLDMTAMKSDRYVWRCERDEGIWVLSTGGRDSTPRKCFDAAEQAIAQRDDAGPEEKHKLIEQTLPDLTQP